MTGDPTITMLDDDPTADLLPGDAEPTPVVGSASSSPAPGSILSRLQEDRDRQRRESSTILPVGRSDVLACRYRALTDDEIRKIARRIEQRQKTRRRSQEDEGPVSGALTLAMACVELMWVGDGAPVPLVDALAADGVDTEGDQPLRYDRRLVRVLGLDLDSENASSVDVVLALHTWEDEDGNTNLIPLGSIVGDYGRWIDGEGDSLEELLEGM